MPADRLVLVVHGVGDQEPGETVRPLARALAAMDGRHQLDPRLEVLWLEDDGEDGRTVDVFPCHVERLRTGGTVTLLGEVFWADISRVRGGLLGALRGFFNIVFGLRHVARSASDPWRRTGKAEPAARVLRWLSNLLAHLLNGPVAASNALLVVTVAVAGALLALRRSPQIEEPLAGGLVVGVGLLALILGPTVGRGWQGRQGRVFCLWVTVTGLLYLFTPLGPHWLYGRVGMITEYYDDRVFALLDSGAFDLTFYCFLLVDLVGFAWVVTAAVMVVALAAWGWAWWRAPERFRPGVHAAQVANAATAGLWFLVVPTFWVAAYQRLPEGVRGEQTARILNEGLRLTAFHWVGALVLGLVALAIVARRLLWARRHVSVEDYDPNSPAPRLLLGEALQGALILASLVGATLVLALFWAAGAEPESLLRGRLNRMFDLFDQGNAIAFQAAVALSAVAMALLPYLRVGLDIGLDVIDHFREETGPEVGAAGVGASEKDTGKAAEAPPPGFVHRRRVMRRFEQVLNHLVDASRAEQVTVVAHSQGSIAAIDSLALEPPHLAGATAPSCTLVTLGSPFGHLYQHYFPGEYPSLSDGERWRGLEALTRRRGTGAARSASRWFNIFRIDDFVGTEIEAHEGWPENRAVALGGHTGYWTDRDVLKILVGDEIRLLG